MSFCVEDVMTRSFVAVDEDCSICGAAELMEKTKVDYLMVMKENILSGILSERDIMNGVVSKGLSPSTTKVAEVMTRNFPMVAPETSLEKAASIMQSGDSKEIPVISVVDGKLVGVLTWTDFGSTYSELNSLSEIEKMASKLGHDLFGQFGTIRNSVYIIEKKPEETTKFTSYINEAIDTSTEIIESLRSRTSKMLITQMSTDLDKFILSVIGEIALPREVIIRKRLNSKSQVNIDRVKMKRVVDNLLRNAVDAMPCGGKIVVTTSSEKGSAIISIIDQCGSKSGDYKRVGINFSKKIVEAHNGEMRIENHEGVGSVAEIKLPFLSP